MVFLIVIQRGWTIIGNPIYDRAEEASFFAEFFASFIGNGVYPNPSTGMQVLANNGMNLKIQQGKCFINGYFGLVEKGGEIIAIEPADANYSRIDRIVARWDLEIRKIIPFVLKGTPASKPVAPQLTRNSNIYEIALADVAIKANTTAITQANITDRRLDTSLCGVVTGIVQQLDTTTLFNQYQTWFEERKQESTKDYQEWFNGFTEPSEQHFTEWFNRMKDQLSEDAAGNLQSQIDQTREEGIIVSPTEPQTDRRKVWFQKGKNIVPTDFSMWASGQYNSGTGVAENSTVRVRLNSLLKVQAGETYYFNTFSDFAFIIRTYNKDGTFSRNIGGIENGGTIITNSNEGYLGVTLYKPNGTTTYPLYEDYRTLFANKTIKPMICLNCEDKSYIEHIEPTIYTKNNNGTYEDFLQQVLEDIKRKTLEAENPVGHIRMETTNVNPATYLGFGTWTLWGSGRVPVGVNTADTDFATVEKTGGSKTVKLTLAQIPSHTHTFTGAAHNHGMNNHTHTYSKSATTTASHTLTTAEMPKHTHSSLANGYVTKTDGSGSHVVLTTANTGTTTVNGGTGSSGGGGGHTHGITLTTENTGGTTWKTNTETATGINSTAGGDEAHTNVQPYITCYMWKRTA